MGNSDAQGGIYVVGYPGPDPMPCEVPISENGVSIRKTISPPNIPSTVRLGECELLTAIRCRNDRKAWIKTYRCLDNGKHWKLEHVPAPDLGTGHPPRMIRLQDGRVCLASGYQAKPFGIQARLSADGGQ
jgi:hypothetical protein